VEGGTQVRTHLCSIRTVWTETRDAREAVAELAAALASHAPVAHLLIFFSSDYDPEILNAALTTTFPGTPVSGCSMSGGMAPSGGFEHGLVAVAFPAKGFRIASIALDTIDRLDVEGTAAAVRALRRRLEPHGPETRPGRFALCLIDGLANAEEAVVSAIAWALDGIPLVGGSAGDDLVFRETVLLHGGRIRRRSAVLLLIDSDYPIEIFRSDNFEPTQRRFVVTASDEDRRVVHELNAEPAAQEYAAAIGLKPDLLSPLSFATHPLAVKVGGEYFCRAIRHMNPDGSLTFFCAVEEGVVLTLARHCDLVESTRAELDRIDAAVGGIDLVIGFECVLRRLDADSRQLRQGVAELYRRYSVVGFETYGEQFRAMHLNQTFTGIAIGRAPES